MAFFVPQIPMALKRFVAVLLHVNPLLADLLADSRCAACRMADGAFAGAFVNVRTSLGPAAEPSTAGSLIRPHHSPRFSASKDLLSSPSDLAESMKVLNRPKKRRFTFSASQDNAATKKKTHIRLHLHRMFPG